VGAYYNYGFKVIKAMELQPAIDLLFLLALLQCVSTSAEYRYLPPRPIGDHEDHENKKVRG
jgi:hypothetical protein